MGIFIDLTSKVFGQLTVISRAQNNKHNNAQWLCQCTCGKTTVVVATGLLKKNGTKSCGCLRIDNIKKTRTINLVGKVFGLWTVLSPAGSKHDKLMWLCRCECGTEREVRGNNLKTGLSTHCGCVNYGKIRERTFKDLTGQTFGRLTVIEKTDKRKNHSMVYLCRCACGNTKLVASTLLIRGGTKSCGCLQQELWDQRGDESGSWKGGVVKNNGGYTLLFMPNHPNAIGRYVAEHVFVMSQIIGRPILKGETVHHKNGIKSDNSPSNLELWVSSHPPGQRVVDLIAWAKSLLIEYEPIIGTI